MAISRLQEDTSSKGKRVPQPSATITPKTKVLDVGRSQSLLPLPRGSAGGAGAATSTAAGTPAPKTINKRPSLSEPGLGTGLCDFWKPCRKLCVTDGIKNPFTLHGRPGAPRQLLLSSLLGGYLLCRRSNQRRASPKETALNTSIV